MFDKVTFDASAPFVAVIVFVIALSVFIFIVVRALRMSKKDLDKMSQMPLEEEKKDKE
jgi:preprotein translocase subunit YajC